MKTILLTAGLTLAALICPAGAARTDKLSEPAGSPAAFGAEQKITLENPYLTLEFIPESMGRIGNVIYRPDHAALFTPYEVRIDRTTPLFAPRTDNASGVRELLWAVAQMQQGGKAPMEVKAQDERSITFYSPHYGNSSFALTRKVTLPADALIVGIHLDFVNGSERAQETAVWFNLLPKTGAAVIMPAAGKKTQQRGRGLPMRFECDTLYGGCPGESWCVPAADWMAMALNDPAIVFAVQFDAGDMRPDGFFYSWQGPVHGRRVQTFEAVFGNRRFEPGKGIVMDYRLMVFPGLTNLRAVCGDCGIDGTLANGRAEVELVAAAPRPAQTAVVKLLPAQGAPVELWKWSVPALKTGEKARTGGVVPGGLAAGRCVLGLELDGRTVALTGAAIER